MSLDRCRRKQRSKRFDSIRFRYRLQLPFAITCVSQLCHWCFSSLIELQLNVLAVCIAGTVVFAFSFSDSASVIGNGTMPRISKSFWHDPDFKHGSPMVNCWSIAWWTKSVIKLSMKMDDCVSLEAIRWSNLDVFSKKTNIMYTKHIFEYFKCQLSTMLETKWNYNYFEFIK